MDSDRRRTIRKILRNCCTRKQDIAIRVTRVHAGNPPREQNVYDQPGEETVPRAVAGDVICTGSGSRRTPGPDMTA